MNVRNKFVSQQKYFCWRFDVMVHDNVVQFEYQSILPVHKLTLKPSILPIVNAYEKAEWRMLW